MNGNLFSVVGAVIGNVHVVEPLEDWEKELAANMTAGIDLDGF